MSAAPSPVYTPDHYRMDLVDLVTAFAYEYCEECGLDVHMHEFRPDALGRPHAFCIVEGGVVGKCPSCRQDVRLDDPDGIVWTTVGQLSPENPFGAGLQDMDEELPLHSTCYDKGEY